MAKTSPTQRALAYCKKAGWTVQIVEKWNVHAMRTIDLFGCIDLVAIDGLGGGPIGIQVTSGDNHASRRTKALEEPRLVAWLRAPARFEVWSFSKRGERGKRKLWQLRREVITVGGEPSAPVFMVKEASPTD